MFSLQRNKGKLSSDLCLPLTLLVQRLVPRGDCACLCICMHAVMQFMKNKDKAGLLKGTPNIYWVWPSFSVCSVPLSLSCQARIPAVNVSFFCRFVSGRCRTATAALSLADFVSGRCTNCTSIMFFRLCFLGGVQVYLHYVWQILFLGGVQTAPALCFADFVS